MSERLELYREAIDAWNRGDLDWFRGRQADEIEVRPLSGIPGLDEAYYGWNGWEEFWNAWRDAWETVTIEFDRLEDLGEEGVRAVITFDGVGKESGAAVRLTAVHLLGFDEGNLFASSLTFWPDEAKRRWPDLAI